MMKEHQPKKQDWWKAIKLFAMSHGRSGSKHLNTFSDWLSSSVWFDVFLLFFKWFSRPEQMANVNFPDLSFSLRAADGKTSAQKQFEEGNDVFIHSQLLVWHYQGHFWALYQVLYQLMSQTNSREFRGIQRSLTLLFFFLPFNCEVQRPFLTNSLCFHFLITRETRVRDTPVRFLLG